MTIDLDLTRTSVTFPDPLKPEVPRDTLVKWLRDRFSSDRRVILVEGPDGAGKTTLLAHFARTYADRCFSFFVRKDYWTSSPDFFLREICAQMREVIQGESGQVGGDYYELRELFGKLYHQVARRARRLDCSFFFVVDGLEWIPESSSSDSIIDLLPHDPLDRVYLLVSATPGTLIGFDHHCQPIQFFSPSDTANYLQRVGIEDEEDIQQIYEACDGMPGYLDQIRREIQSGTPVEEVLTGLPSGFQELLNREWERMGIRDDGALNALAVLAHSQTPINAAALARIVGVERERLEEKLDSIPQVEVAGGEATLRFVTDAHRRFATDKLSSRRMWAYQALIAYHEEEPLSENSQTQLPILYSKTGSFGALTDYVSTKNLVYMLRQTRDIRRILQNVQMVAREAYDRKEWQILSKYALMSSILRTLSTRSAAESEVDALLAMGDYQQSVAVADRAVLPEDRLQLLARIGSYVKRQEDRPISGEVLSSLERMVSEIELKGGVRERVIEIAADLFYVHPQAAKDLVEKVAGVDTSGRLMDVVLAALALRLEGEAARSAETLRSRIRNHSLREFARANSPAAADLIPDEVLAEAERLQDTSAKLFLLRSWCNKNRRHPEAIKVVEAALEIMTVSADYTPSMRHLRQFAEPLQAGEDVRAYELVDRFDLLKDTAIEKPAEEAVRLELVLASVEAKKSKDTANQRLLDTYYELKNIAEQDIRCYCLVRILLSLPRIDPEDPLQMQKEIEKNLPIRYRQLVNDSAHHWALTRRLLSALTNYDPGMAIDFASELNTAERRDKAYREILRVYIDQELESIDLSLADDTLDRVSEKSWWDRTLVQVLEQIADKDIFGQLPEARELINRRLIGRISDMQGARWQCLAYAHSLRIAASDAHERAAKNRFDAMVGAWSSIDKRWQQVHVGFDLVAILAEEAPEFARRVLELTREIRAATPLAEGIPLELYVNSVGLAIRAFSDIIKSKDCADDRIRLMKAIERIPSCALQCQLFSELALRHHLAGKEQVFEEIVNREVLPRLEDCEDKEAYAQTVIDVAPCLFQYERELLSERLSELSAAQKDRALGKVVTYLLSGRSPADPIDLTSLNVRPEYICALRACDAIEQMSTDAGTYAYLSVLVDQILQPHPTVPDREGCLFMEKRALRIAKNLKAIVDDRFPDPNNIQHDGYKLAAQACLARLRAGAAERWPHRAEERWAAIAPSWTEIAEAVRGIPNAADRALVMAWVGEKMYRSKPNLGQQLLREARGCIDEIPNIIDRGSRLEALASSWKQLDDRESAKCFIEEGMTILEAWSWDQTRDQVTGKFLELAHSLDPEFAASLTSTVDNPYIRYGLEQDVASRDLQHEPATAADEELHIEDLHSLLGRSATRLLRSFCSGKGLVRRREVTGEWTRLMVGAQFEEAYQVAAWSIQNELARTKSASAPVLGYMYAGILDSLEAIWQVSELLLGTEDRSKDVRRRSPSVLTSIRLFSVGSRQEALEAVQSWLRENAQDYVKIYDPYFTAADLDVLKGIPSGLRVTIMTSWEAQEGVPFDDPAIAARYQDAWSRISDLRPPETHVYVFGIKHTGQSPMHNRYYITADGGIHLGTSRSGLGNKDSSISSLSRQEAASIEAEQVDRLIVHPPLHFKGERLIVRTFTL